MAVKKTLMAGILTIACAAVYADEACNETVAAGIVSFDRDARIGAGLLLNRCGQPVKAELLVVARNAHGLPVAKGHAVVETADAAPLSVITVELPFVHSDQTLSDYVTFVQSAQALTAARARTASTGHSAWQDRIVARRHPTTLTPTASRCHRRVPGWPGLCSTSTGAVPG